MGIQWYLEYADNKQSMKLEGITDLTCSRDMSSVRIAENISKLGFEFEFYKSYNHGSLTLLDAKFKDHRQQGTL